MSVQTQVLIDAAQSLVHDGEILASRKRERPEESFSVRIRTCRGGRSEGVDVIEIDNGQLCIDVLPTRGMGIWRVRRHSFPSPSQPRGGGSEMTLGWRAPAGGPVNPAFVPLMEPGGLGWLDGFSELLCRCGLESNGPPEFDEAGRLVRPLHGRIANLPAQHVELLADEAAGQLTVRGVVEESRFHFQSLRLTASISTAIGSNEFTWTDEVENIGGRDATLQILYHFNVGQPLLRAGARIVAPVAAVAPLTDVAAREGVEQWNIMPPPRPGSAEQVYCLELAADDTGNTRVLVTGLADENAVELRLNKRPLPCFTVWRNTPDERDGYVVGIEPATNYPNPRSFEQQHGRVVALKPGERWRAAVSAVWHTNARAISDAEAAIAALQARQPTEFSSSPRGDWSASA